MTFFRSEKVKEVAQIACRRGVEQGKSQPLIANVSGIPKNDVILQTRKLNVFRQIDLEDPITTCMTC